MKGGKPVRRLLPILALLFAALVPSVSLADTRALLVACSDFVTQPDLGSAISGNVQMIASALLGVLSFTCFWSILEIFEQRERVAKGWFPAGPSHRRHTGSPEQ